MMLAHDSTFSTEFYTCCISSTISDGVRTNSMGVVFIRFYVVCADVILNCRVTLLGKTNRLQLWRPTSPPRSLAVTLTCWVRGFCPDLTQHGQCFPRERTRRPRCCTSGRTPAGRSVGLGSLSAACVRAGPGEDHPARSPCPGHSPGRNPDPGRNLCRGHNLCHGRSPRSRRS